MNDKKKEYVNFIIILSIIILISFYISNHWYQFMLISGDSMLPSFRSMQIVVLDKHSKEYGYGDVVAFECDGLNAILVKRIVACPKDTVIIKEGTLYVNNKVSNIFSKQVIFEFAGIAEEEIYLKENQYFVVGDNITKSKDSRYIEIGLVCKEDILGKVLE